MSKKYMKHIDECGMYYYICNGEEIIAEAFYGDDAQDIVDLLNGYEEQIEGLKRHIERNTISRITVEDVLGCAKYSRFYGNEEIAEAIDCIAKDLGVNLY